MRLSSVYKRAIILSKIRSLSLKMIEISLFWIFEIVGPRRFLAFFYLLVCFYDIPDELSLEPELGTKFGHKRASYYFLPFFSI